MITAAQVESQEWEYADLTAEIGHQRTKGLHEALAACEGLIERSRHERGPFPDAHDCIDVIRELIQVKP